MDSFDKSNPVNKLSINNTHKEEHTEKDSFSINHITHDLNNIFTRIINSVELIKKKLPEYDSIAPFLASIENGTFLASEIIEDVILENNGKQPRKREVNLNSLIHDLVNSLSIHFADRINFVLKLDKDIQFVEGRYSDYYRIIMNLIINASEAVADRGEITILTFNTAKANSDQKDVTLFDSGKFVEIIVKDNGRGIDKSILPHIFEDEFTTKTKKRNSGHGLAIVKNIVEDNNGTIFVTSEKNKGTEFICRFPAIENKEREKDPGSKSILIAEDEEIQRMLLKELLESYNYKTTAVSNGKFLLEELNTNNYDLLIVDNQMPDIDGVECIKKIREMNFDIPIILAAGSQTNIGDLSKERIAADKFIGKPYNFTEMLGLINDLIDR